MSVVEFERPMDRRSVRARLFNPPNAVADPEEKTVGTLLAEARAEGRQLSYENEKLRAELKATLERLATAHLTIEQHTKAATVSDRYFPAEVAPEGFGMQHNQLKYIVRAISEHLGVSIQGIMSARRVEKLVYARQLACYLAKHLTSLSFTAIGRRLGRDHSTIIHSISKIEGLIATDVTVRLDVAAIKARLS